MGFTLDEKAVAAQTTGDGKMAEAVRANDWKFVWSKVKSNSGFLALACAAVIKMGKADDTCRIVVTPNEAYLETDDGDRVDIATGYGKLKRL